MRSWVIQIKPAFFGLGAKGKQQQNASNFALHVPPFDPKRKHTIEATSTGKVNETAKRCSTLMNPEIAYWTNTNPSMFFSAQEASNNQSRETSGLLSIFVHLFVILPYVCFCHLFLLLSLDQRFGPSRPIIEGGNVAAPTRARARARLRSVSWLHLANLLICVVPQSKRTKWELMKQNQRNYFQNNQNLTENLFSKLGFSAHSSMYSGWKVIQVCILKHRPTEGDRLWCLTMGARDLQNAARWKFVTANLWAHHVSRENIRKQYNHSKHLLKRPQRSIFCKILHIRKGLPAHQGYLEI